MKYVKLFEQFLNELADGSTAVAYTLSKNVDKDYVAKFTTKSGLDYEAWLDDNNKELFYRPINKPDQDTIAHKLAATISSTDIDEIFKKIQSISTEDIKTYTVIFNNIDEPEFATKDSDMTERGEAVSIISTVQNIMLDVIKLESSAKLLSFSFIGLYKKDEDRSKPSSRTRLYRMFMKTNLPAGFSCSDDKTNVTYIVRLDK